MVSVAPEGAGVHTISLVAAELPLRATMKSADSYLIHFTSSKLLCIFRFNESRSYLACHRIRFPTQPLDYHSA